MDFMGEHATSPIDGVTRRYPQIIIMKPFNSCPQICVYCQRNWEIKDIDDNPMMPRTKVMEMLEWAREDKKLSEILITGGDPFTLPNKYLDWLIGEVAGMDHIDRIRIGTRTLVTLPQRINDGLLKKRALSLFVPILTGKSAIAGSKSILYSIRFLQNV